MDSKLPETGTTIFTVMSQLAAETGAINLSQGFPEFDPDPGLVELVGHYMRNGANQYAPMTGVPPLREAVASHQRDWYGLDYDPDDLASLPEGGMGLYLLHSLMDHVDYVSRDGRNVLTLERRFRRG